MAIIHPVALGVVGPCPQQSSPRCRSTSGSSGALLCREKRYCRSDLTSLDIISWSGNVLVGGWVELDLSDPIWRPVLKNVVDLAMMQCEERILWLGRGEGR